MWLKNLAFQNVPMTMILYDHDHSTTNVQLNTKTILK